MPELFTASLSSAHSARLDLEGQRSWFAGAVSSTPLLIPPSLPVAVWRAAVDGAPKELLSCCKARKPMLEKEEIKCWGLA